MDRRHFIATVGVASAAVAASTVLEENWAHAEPQRDPDKRPPAVVDDRFLDTLTAINDLQVPNTLAGYQAQIDSLASPRALAQSAMRLVSAYVNRRGANHHAESLLGPVATLLTALAERQNPSGLYDIGNLDSPPDTSFVIADLGLSYVLLADDDQPATAAIRARYAAIMRKSGTALAEGGVHTPNHRWEICKALAHLNHLWPSRLLKARINDWLGEGIDQDGEGEYSERSPNYASEVTNKSLLTIARYADKPALREQRPPQPAADPLPDPAERRGGDRPVPAAGPDRCPGQLEVPDPLPRAGHPRPQRAVRRGGRADPRSGRRGPGEIRHQRLLRG